jgi:adenylate cyclase
LTREQDLQHWLINQAATLPGMPEVLWALIGKLHGMDVPVARLACGEPTLHPETKTFGYRWEDGEGGVGTTAIGHGIERTDTYLDNPFRLILEGLETTIRRRLEGDGALDFPVLEELRDAGFTDYLVFALPSSAHRVAPLAWCTRRPGGFREDDIDLLAAILPALGLIAETHARQRLTRVLLDTYLGHDAGRQVLDGHVQLGDVATIRAVLWFCDLRGFTAMSDRLPPEFLIHVLNDYFAAMATPVQSHGGEILKFIGDAMLAIFRIGGGDDAGEVCETALSAAQMAVQDMRRLNRRRGREGKPPLDFGLALHLGDVMYGNIGASNRLDFTVIGPAVNLAARLQTLAGETDHQLVASAAFAKLCPAGSMTSIGRFPLKGIAEAQEAFVSAPAGD